MPTFAFQARTKTGEQVTGTREAADISAARDALRAAELFVTDLRQQAGEAKKSRGTEPAPRQAPPAGGGVAVAPSGRAAGVAGIGQRATPPQIAPPQIATPREPSDHPSPGSVPITTQYLAASSSKALSLYYRQLYAMLNAGTGISHALNTMSTHAPSLALRKASREMSERTAAGHPLSEQMRAYPGLFSELQRGLIAAGENGGFLDRMCLRLAEYSERDYALDQSIKAETWYPKLLIACSILIPATVPAFLAGHAGGNGFLTFLKVVGPQFAVLGLIYLAWTVFSRVLKVTTHGGFIRELLDGAKFVLPVMSGITRALASAKFCRAMGALYAAGTGSTRAIDIAAGACGNAAFAARVRRVIPEIQNGAQLTGAMASTKQFSAIALQMMHTGEISGQLDTQLDKVADFLEADAEAAIKKGVKVLGIVIYLIVAVYVGSQIIGQYTSTFTGIMDDADKLSEGN